MPTERIAPANARVRNQAMECFKMVAAIFVVFLHVPFPGKAEGWMLILANSAVPLFFAITGYFNYGASQRTLTRRIKHLLRLYLVAMLASVAFGIITTELTGGSSVAFLITYFPKREEIMNWLLLHQDPRNAQLWYLTSVCLCYLVLYLYVRFFGDEPVSYRPLYCAAFSLFAVFLALGCLAPVAGLSVPYLLYRNGFFWGLPMFTLGIFLREYQERILTNFNLTSGKLLALALVGCLFGIAQYFTVGMGQAAMGTLLEIPALLLFMTYHPTVTKERGFLSACVGKFGAWSTYVYILHIQILSVYTRFCRPAMLTVFSESAEAWIQPFAVAALSLIAAIVFTWGEQLLKRLHRRK